MGTGHLGLAIEGLCKEIRRSSNNGARSNSERLIMEVIMTIVCLTPPVLLYKSRHHYSVIAWLKKVLRHGALFHWYRAGDDALRPRRRDPVLRARSSLFSTVTVVCRKVRPIDWRTLFQDPRLISSPEEKWSDHIATEVYPIQSSAKALEKIETAWKKSKIGEKRR